MLSVSIFLKQCFGKLKWKLRLYLNQILIEFLNRLSRNGRELKFFLGKLEFKIQWLQIEI